MEQFRSALEALVRQSCATLADEPPQHRTWYRIVREDGGYSFPTEVRDDYSDCISRFRMRCYSDPTMLNAVAESIRTQASLREALLVDAGGNAITDRGAQSWWIENILVSRVLSAYASRAGGFRFDQQVFKALFEDLQTEILCPYVHVSELSPLMNAKLDSDRIRINDNVCLRRIATTELEQWFNTDGPWQTQPVRTHELLQLDCAIEVTYQQEPHRGPGSAEAREQLLRLLTAIRLLTDASPRVAFTIARTSGFQALSSGTTWTSSVATIGPEAKIDESQQSKLVELFGRLTSSPNLEAIRLALARWNSAIDRPTEEDKLIDYWIALESLFVPDATQELRYRTSLRIAAFLGTNADERTRLYKHVKDSYDLRSEIVHGSIPKRNRRVASPDLIRLTHCLLRQSLIGILQSDVSFDPSECELQLLSKA